MHNKYSFVSFLLLINVLIRIFHHGIYSPVVFSDTKSYLDVANCIWIWDFSNYIGDRPPMYPMVMLLNLIDERLIWIFQSLLGVFNSLIIYYVVRNLTEDKIAFFTAIAFSLSLNILFAESALLSETTSTFFLLLTLLAFSEYIDNKARHYLIQIGLFSSLAVLTRPIMIVLIPAVLLTLYLVYSNYNFNKKFILSNLLYFLIPVLIILFSYSYFNKVQVGYFSITTLTGFNLSNHSGAFVENCQDPEYQQIKEILIDYRYKMGTHRWGAMEAQNELMQRTGLSYSELSQKLTMMSLKLFIQNPVLYLKSVGNSFINYWGAGNVWDVKKISPGYIQSIFEYLWLPQKIILITINLMFIISLALLIVIKRKLYVVRDPIMLVIFLVIVFSSILQALVESGENTRYKLPFQPLILIFVIKIIYEVIHIKISNKTSILKSYFMVLKEI